jgi:hypothetical protein
MGFFSNIKNRARGMPMAPQPMQELRAGQIMPNSPQVGRSSSPSRMPAPPVRFDRATAPVLNPGNIGGNLGSDFRAPQKRSGLGGLLPQQNLDFLNKLPKNMMPNLDFSNLPQNIRPGFFGGRDVNIDDGGMVDFLNSNPEQVLFGIENRIGILQNQLEEAKANRDRESFDMIVQEINDADAQRIEIMNSMKPNVDRMIEAGRGRTLSNRDREILGETGRTISNMDRGYIDDILSSLEKKN